MMKTQVLQQISRSAHNAGASTKASEFHATMRRVVQRLVDEGTHEAAPQLLQKLLRFADNEVDHSPLLAAALQVVATLLQLDEPCRAAAVGNDTSTVDGLHIVLQLCTRPGTERCKRAAMEVLHALVCAARDYQRSAVCRRVLEAGSVAGLLIVIMCVLHTLMLPSQRRCRCCWKLPVHTARGHCRHCMQHSRGPQHHRWMWQVRPYRCCRRPCER